MSQVVTVPNEVLDELGLIAFRKAIAAQPPLLEVSGLHFERVANKPPRRKPHPGMRRVGRRMRSPIHPDRPLALEGLVIPVDGDKPVGVRITFLPGTRVSNRTNLAWCDVPVALMMPQRDARDVVRERKQTRGLVDCV